MALLLGCVPWQPKTYNLFSSSTTLPAMTLQPSRKSWAVLYVEPHGKPRSLMTNAVRALCGEPLNSTCLRACVSGLSYMIQVLSGPDLAEAPL